MDQVKDLSEKDKQREKQIDMLETRINKIEQQNILRNIEIKNVTNEEMTPNEIITSLDVEMRETDISNEYRPKMRNDKIVIEFTSLGKKTRKISQHRLDANIVNNTEK